MYEAIDAVKEHVGSVTEISAARKGEWRWNIMDLALTLIDLRQKFGSVGDSMFTLYQSTGEGYTGTTPRSS